MTSTQALQNLQEKFKKVTEQSKLAQGSLQQLRSAKKEAEIKQRQQVALANLRALGTTMAELQQHMRETEQQLGEALGEKPETKEAEEAEKEEKTSKSKPEGIIETRRLTIEEQEALYTFKSSRTEAQKSQNNALKQEVLLQEKKQQMVEARYAQSQAYPGSKTLRAAHALEAQLRGAKLKIKGLEEELHRSQEMTVKYRELHEKGQHDAEHKESENSSKPTKSTGQTRNKSSLKPAPLEQQSFIGPHTNVNDLVRKNECLLEENELQNREIQRLLRDNAQLLLLAKSASTQKHAVFAKLGTSESARYELNKRFEKLKYENDQLSHSYTRQASEWLEIKKLYQAMESEDRWRAIHHVPPHGVRDRWFHHPGMRNTDKPRQMFPVEKYASTSTA